MQDKETSIPKPAGMTTGTAPLDVPPMDRTPSANYDYSLIRHDGPRFSANPWERQPGESSRSYRVFCVYRDLGPTRSLAAVFRVLKGSEEAQNGPKKAPDGPKWPSIPGSWKRWSRQYRWSQRVREWDEALSQRRMDVCRAAEEEIIRSRVTRRLRGQAAFESFASRMIDELTAAAPEMLRPGQAAPDSSGRPPSVASPLHLARLMKELRILETALQEGFPKPGPSQW